MPSLKKSELKKMPEHPSNIHSEEFRPFPMDIERMFNVEINCTSEL
jgi:hypothetical protein